MRNNRFVSRWHWYESLSGFNFTSFSFSMIKKKEKSCLIKISYYLQNPADTLTAKIHPAVSNFQSGQNSWLWAKCKVQNNLQAARFSQKESIYIFIIFFSFCAIKCSCCFLMFQKPSCFRKVSTLFSKWPLQALVIIKPSRQLLHCRAVKLKSNHSCHLLGQ